MSGATPSKRLQLRTSDLADFFRGSSSGPSSTGSNSVVFEDSQVSSSSSPSKRRSTRIPFIGRSRKKSTHSDVVTSVTSNARESRSSVTTAGSRSVLEQHGGAIASLPHASTSQQSLKTATTSNSFGSKIAAHFTPSKSLGNLKLARKRSTKRPGEQSGYTSESLAPPSSGARSPSIDSKSSQLSRHDRSSTPRASHTNEELAGSPPQPTITVSRPDDFDNLDEYDDLFTKPRNKAKAKPVPIDIRPLYQSSEMHPSRSSPTSPSPPSSPTFHTSTSTITRTPSAVTRMPHTTAVDSISRINSVPRAHKLSHGSTDSSRPSMSGASVTSFRRLPLKPKEGVKQHSIDIDPAEESEAMSVKSAMSMPTSFRRTVKAPETGPTGILEKRRSLATPYSPKGTGRSPPSRISRPSKPPSYPIPATPSPSSSPSSSPPQSPVPRPRAHTISSSRTSSLLARSSDPSTMASPSLKRNNTASKTLGGSSPLSKDSTPQSQSTDRNSSSSSSSSSSTPTLTKILPHSTPVEIDVDNASVDELRKALQLRNQQFDELSKHLHKITEAHTAEKTVWEKRILDLEREAARRDKEIKGLTWLVKNDGIGSTATEQSGSRTPSLFEMERSDDSSARSSLPTPSSSIRLPLNRLLQGEDSGAESYPTSTSNSEWGSGTSGAEDESQLAMAMMKPRRAMKKLRLVESANKSVPITRPIPLKQPGPGSEISISDLLKPSKRSSASSSFTVASSSTSSEHSPTSLTFPNPQTLIPIPESRAKENHASLASDKDEYKRERRPSKVSFKQSGQPSASASKSPIDSVTPGSRLTPSEAYIRNLKKGRPPSIAQVLDLSEKADQPTGTPISSIGSIEDSYGGRSRALLAGVDRPAMK